MWNNTVHSTLLIQSFIHLQDAYKCRGMNILSNLCICSCYWSNTITLLWLSLPNQFLIIENLSYRISPMTNCRRPTVLIYWKCKHGRQCKHVQSHNVPRGTCWRQAGLKLGARVDPAFNETKTKAPAGTTGWLSVMDDLLLRIIYPCKQLEQIVSALLHYWLGHNTCEPSLQQNTQNTLSRFHTYLFLSTNHMQN